MSPMFDFKLHDNKVTPDMGDRLQCGYCKTRFHNRAELFYHLGFMNIDITNSVSTMETDDNASTSNDFDEVAPYDEDAGDYGFVFKRKKARKLMNFHAHKPKAVLKKKVKGTRLDKLTNTLSKISLDNIK